MRKITISIVHDDAHSDDLEIIQASLNAIQETIPVEFSITKSKSAQTQASADWILWFSDSDIPTFDSVKSLILNPQPSNQLIRQKNSTQWVISKRLTIDVARKENLTLQLASLLLADPALTNKLELFDNRMLPDSVILSGAGDASTLKAGLLPQAPNQYLILFFLLILITERIIAYARKQ